MSKLVKFSTILALSASLSFGATQSEIDAVKAHVNAGVEFCKQVGVSKCVEEFNKKESKWVSGNMYIWANDFDGVITAHPKKPLKGKNLIRYKDKAGNTLFADFVKKVQADGEGWVDYVWSHPVTNKQADKTSFVKGIGENQLIGCGIYKNDGTK